MAAAVHRTRTHHHPQLTAGRDPSRRREQPTAPAPSAPSGPIRGLRRWWAGAFVAGTLSLSGLGALGVLSGPGGVPASAAGTGPAPVVRTVKAHPGDSLWSIAEHHRGDVPIQRYVDALIDLNGGSTSIVAGQLVRVP